MKTDDYTTIRIKRGVKFDIERIAALHWEETGEKLYADQVVERAVEFLMRLITEKSTVVGTEET